MTTLTRNTRIFKDSLNQRGPSKTSKNDKKHITCRRPALKNISNIQNPITAENVLKGKFKPKSTKCNGKSQMKVDEILKLEEPSQCTMDGLLIEVKDIDSGDKETHTMCAEYVKDIYSYLRRSERRFNPKTDYMHHQTEITEKMRMILIDWLIQVHSKFHLIQETLYLTVYILDRYLEKATVKRSELQLLGVTSMLLASKYEETFAPEIGDFVYITDNAYSKDEVQRMEQEMLEVLEYDFSDPLGLHFLRRNSKAGGMNKEKHDLAKFLMELSLISYKFVSKYPSQIAAAALFLAIKIIDSSEWTSTLEHYSGYSEQDILPVVGDLAALVLSGETAKYDAVASKYRKLRGHLLGPKVQTIKSYTCYSK